MAVEVIVGKTEVVEVIERGPQGEPGGAVPKSNYIFQFIESLSKVFTNSRLDGGTPAPVNIIDQDLEFDEGEHKVTIGFDYGVDDKKATIGVRLLIDDVIVDETVKFKADKDHQYCTSKAVPIQFAQGTHNFKVEFGKFGGNNDLVFVEFVRVMIERAEEGL